MPDLAFVESASALHRLVRSKALSAAAGTRCVDKLLRLPISVAKRQPLIVDALRPALATTVYDAVYVTLAQRLSCTLISADAKLVRAMRTRKLDALLLADVS